MKLSNIFVLLLGCLACGSPRDEFVPRYREVVETVFASGNLEAEGTFALAAETEGYLTTLSVEENEIVEAGTVIAEIKNPRSEAARESANTLYAIARTKLSEDSPQLLKAQREMEQARKQMQFDSIQETRYAKLLQSGSVPRQDYENRRLQFETSMLAYHVAQQAYKAQRLALLEDLANRQSNKKINEVAAGNNQIKAAKRARLYQLRKEIGDYVRAGDVIALLGDPHHLYASVSIDEGSIRKVKKGQQAFVSLNTHEDKIYNAVVREILPSFNEEGQSYEAHLEFQGTLDFKAINTQLQANIVVARYDSALVIPIEYLSTARTVEVRDEDAPRSVTVKFISDQWAVIASGLTTNDVIVKPR